MVKMQVEFIPIVTNRLFLDNKKMVSFFKFGVKSITKWYGKVLLKLFAFTVVFLLKYLVVNDRYSFVR